MVGNYCKNEVEFVIQEVISRISEYNDFSESIIAQRLLVSVKANKSLFGSEDILTNLISQRFSTSHKFTVLTKGLLWLLATGINIRTNVFKLIS